MGRLLMVSTFYQSSSLTFVSIEHELSGEWARRIDTAHLLQAMTPQEIGSETTSVYDNYVEVLETGSVAALAAIRP